MAQQRQINKMITLDNIFVTNLDQFRNKSEKTHIFLIGLKETLRFNLNIAN